MPQTHSILSAVPETVPSPPIALGSFVTLEEAGREGVREYLLVPPGEAGAEGHSVSSASPLGRALMGRKAGDSLAVQVPKGTLRFRILSVR